MASFKQRLIKIKSAMAKTEKAKQEERKRLLKIHLAIVSGRWIWTALFGISSLVAVLMERFGETPVFAKHLVSQNIGFYLILVFLVIYNFSFWLYLRKKEKCTWQGLNILKYLQAGCDLVLATFLFHLIGGIDNPVFLIYLLPFFVATILFGRTGVLLMTSLIIVSSILVVFAEHFNIISHRFRYLVDVRIYGNLPVAFYFIITFGLSLFGGAIFAAFLADVLNKREKDLKEKTSQLEDANASLEIRVRARTREFSELAGSLEAQVKERTKEIQWRMTELERFNKLALGREAKVAELEEKRRLLKKELRNL